MQVRMTIFLYYLLPSLEANMAGEHAVKADMMPILLGERVELV